MNCEKFEELLPLYAEDALSGEDLRAVEDHLAACGACRESLALYEELESSLVSRRALRPPAARTASAVVERLGLRGRRRSLPGWIGAPALSGAGFVLAGVGMLLFKGAVADFFAEAGGRFAVGYSHVAAEGTQGLVRAAGGSEWVLLCAYLGLFALIMLTGSWMVLKFVRE